MAPGQGGLELERKARPESMFVFANTVIFEGSKHPGRPRHPWNWLSAAGRASSRTTAPAAKKALHVPAPLPRVMTQLMPAGWEVMVPLPPPPGTMLMLPVLPVVVGVVLAPCWVCSGQRSLDRGGAITDRHQARRRAEVGGFDAELPCAVRRCPARPVHRHRRIRNGTLALDAEFSAAGSERVTCTAAKAVSGGQRPMRSATVKTKRSGWDLMRVFYP